MIKRYKASNSDSLFSDPFGSVPKLNSQGTADRGSCNSSSEQRTKLFSSSLALKLLKNSIVTRGL